jgi:hypothetical protein
MGVHQADFRQLFLLLGQSDYPSARQGISPCIRQRPFGMAGDRHGLPFLVRAPHRGLR